MCAAIDTDESGTISPDEIIAYLLPKCGAEDALRLLKVLDTNSDNRITKDEWHKGWVNGEFAIEPTTPDPKGGARTPQMFSLSSRHLTRGNLLESYGKQAKNSKAKSGKGKAEGKGAKSDSKQDPGPSSTKQLAPIKGGPVRVQPHASEANGRANGQ